MSQTEYPDFVRKRFAQLNQRKGIPIGEIEQGYIKIFHESEMTAKAQFPNATPEQLLIFRQRHAIGAVWNEMIQRTTQEEVEIIYVGHGGMQIGRGSKKAYSNMFVIVQEGNPLIPTLTRMTSRGAMADIYQTLNLFTRYKSNLGRYQKGGDLIVDNRTVFRNATSLDFLDVPTFNKTLNIPEITVAEAVSRPSKKDAKGWTISTDWRCIIGFVSGDPRTFQDKRNPKITRGVCNIADVTVEEEPVVDASGNVVRPGLVAWLAPEFTIYDDGSYCAFYGTISVDTDKSTGKKKASMNSYLVRPIFAQLSEEEE